MVIQKRGGKKRGEEKAVLMRTILYHSFFDWVIEKMSDKGWQIKKGVFMIL